MKIYKKTFNLDEDRRIRCDEMLLIYDNLSHKKRLKYRMRVFELFFTKSRLKSFKLSVVSVKERSVMTRCRLKSQNFFG